MIFALLLACQTPPDGGVCFEAGEQLGFIPCVHVLETHEDFEDVAVDAEAVDQTWTTKYLVPVKTGMAIDESVFVDAQRYALHRDFLAEAFPEEFGSITSASYSEMVLDPENRSFFSGNITEYIDEDGVEFPGFIVWDRSTEDETVTLEEVTTVWEALRDRIGFGELHFVPRTPTQLEALAGWDAPFAIADIAENMTYEAYTNGVGYGTIRRYSVQDLEEATENAEFGFQDILILDEAPWDLEMVVSGLVTGSRQSTLSHLNVRSAARGTPNCFIQSPHALLELYDGQLVRFSCDEEVWRIEETSWEEAEAFWDALRPEPVDIPEPDLETTTMVHLLDLDTLTSAERSAGVATYGSKAANLATLYQRIDPELQLNGFLVPMSAYADFVSDNGWMVDLGEGEVWTSFQETLDAWLTDEDFVNDTAWRRVCLGNLRDAMEETPVDPALLEELGQQIEQTWGDDTTMVRFRSSSNAEDSLSFSGAGLYESARACLADQTDDDDEGPSWCDSSEDDEDTLEDALREVWASLWSMGAHEEREWYGIDHSLAAMGILVNSRSLDEQVNIVLFSGDPIADDDRFLVNAQDGEHDVVSGEPGLTPEIVRVSIEEGTVSEIEREAHSSLSEAAWLLSESQLLAIGEAMAEIRSVYPVDAMMEGDSQILLDTEWKVLENGRLIIKQIRPFARQGSH
jgi:hypothetical protein